MSRLVNVQNVILSLPVLALMTVFFVSSSVAAVMQFADLRERVTINETNLKNSGVTVADKLQVVGDDVKELREELKSMQKTLNSIDKQLGYSDNRATY